MGSFHRLYYPSTIFFLLRKESKLSLHLYEMLHNKASDLNMIFETISLLAILKYNSVDNTDILKYSGCCMECLF